MFAGPRQSELLETRDVSYLDARWRDEAGRLRCLPAAEFRSVPHSDLRLWAWQHAVYQFPTEELVEWLRGTIGDRTALEIGAGNGWLGYHAEVRMTDSYQQQRRPDVVEYYRRLRQPATDPPPEVEALDAAAAVAKYRPQVVVGAWVTHLFDRADPTAEGNIYGVNEVALLASVETYIHLGNQRVHGRKPLRRLHHEQLRPRWLVSRASFPRENVIQVWNR